jgi:ParB/RepB/Spo0J family partition protein
MKIITGKNEAIEQINVNAIHPDPENRKVGGFDEQKLQELANSIKSIGVQQPIIVRRRNPGFDLVAGERRWRATKIAGLETVPAVIRDLSDADVLHIQVIENIQREDIHPLDECNGFFRLMSGPIAYTTADIANEVGKSESYVSQRLRLKHLLPEAVTAFEENQILLGHSILIARLEDKEQKEALKWTLPDPHNQWSSLKPVKDLRDWIERNVYLDLTKAAFPKKSDNLIPNAGSCLLCRKRTDFDPALFPEINENAFCLDKECFNKKIEKHLENQKEIEMPHIAGDYSWNTPDGIYSMNEVTHWNPEWDDPENEDYMEVPDKLTFEECLVVTGPERGKVVLARIDSDEDEKENPEEIETRKAERREEDISRKQFEIFNNKVFKETLEKLKISGTSIITKEFLSLIIKELIEGDGYSDTWTNIERTKAAQGWSAVDDPQDINQDLEKFVVHELMLLLQEIIIESLVPGWWNKKEDTRLEEFAVSKGVDIESLEHESRLEAEAEYEEEHSTAV